MKAPEFSPLGRHWVAEDPCDDHAADLWREVAAIAPPQGAIFRDPPSFCEIPNRCNACDIVDDLRKIGAVELRYIRAAERTHCHDQSDIMLATQVYESLPQIDL